MKSGMKSEAKQRLARMLDADKEPLNEESRRAAEEDFRRVAEEYFETAGPIELTIEQGKKGTLVSVRFLARRVKNFTTLK